MSEQLNHNWIRADVAYDASERSARFLAMTHAGMIAVSGEALVEPMEYEANRTTLMHDVQMASLGDMQARLNVVTNVRTDVAERLLKAGHQTEVELEYVNSALHQNGRKVTDVHSNTLRYTFLNPIMYRRTTHEYKNGFLFDDIVGQGLLQTHHILVFSQATKDTATQKDYNFYTDTDTCSVQLLMSKGDKIVLQTALVAGKKTPTSARHDSEAITSVAAKNGTHIVINDVDDTAKVVMLVPKGTISGVEDIVAQYDTAVGGTFYGQDKPTQDYQQYANECRERDFSAIVDQVTDQLLSEAHLYASPLEVIKRLDYLSERYCVKRSVQDISIDCAVFGAVSAAHIHDARMYLEHGDQGSAHVSLKQAQKTAKSGSCPLYSGIGLGSENENDDSEKSKNKLMSCPDCDALVYDDPCAKFLKCWDCKSYVIGGIKHEGNGGNKKRALLKKQQQAERTQLEHEKIIVTTNSKQIASFALQNSQVAVVA